MIYSVKSLLHRRSKIMPEQESARRATAMFDNAAESSRELDFRKGDTLEILDQMPNGLRGWWLCRSTSGREGLAPANRLRLLKSEAALTSISAVSGDYDVPKPLLTEKRSHNHRHSNGAFSPENSRPLWLPLDSPPSVRSYRSSGSNFTGSIVFRSPPASSSGSSSSRMSIATSDLGSSERNSAEPYGDVYDTLPSATRKPFDRSPGPAKLPSSSSPRTDSDYDYIDADSDSTVTVTPAERDSHYDYLPKRGLVLPRKMVSKDVKKRESFLRCTKMYDTLPRRGSRTIVVKDGTVSPQLTEQTDAVVPTSVVTSPVHKDEKVSESSRVLLNHEPLNVTKQVALTRISLMQSQLQMELSRLFNFVSDPSWRNPAHLIATLVPVKQCCENLVRHLTDLIRFLLRAALTSAQRAADVTLEARLRGLIDAVFVSCKHIRERLLILNQQAWAPTDSTVECIESVVATGQVLTEDVRKMTAFVLGNAQLIFSEEEEARVQTRPLPYRPGNPVDVDGDDGDHEYEDVDYGLVSAPVVPRSPTLERKILNSYIQEVNDEVRLIKPLIAGFSSKMFVEKTVTSAEASDRATAIVTRTSKLARLTDSLSQTLTLSETLELRTKLKKIGGYISTACKTFNLAVRAATKTPDEEHFRGVKGSLDYLNDLCQFLKNSTETEL